jgi:hypothetical protein
MNDLPYYILGILLQFMIFFAFAGSIEVFSRVRAWLREP